MTPNDHQVRVNVLTQACTSTGSILENMTSEQLALPTPCRNRPVHEVINARRRAVALPWACSRRGEEAWMMSGPEGEMAARAADRGRLRASHADRNRVVDVLKAAFIEGRLTKDELDARLGQTLAARTYADLATLTADIPLGTKLARQPQPDRAPA